MKGDEFNCISYVAFVAAGIDSSPVIMFSMCVVDHCRRVWSLYTLCVCV